MSTQTFINNQFEGIYREWGEISTGRYAITVQ